MTKVFRFKLRGDPATTLDRVRATAARAGIVFHGGLKEGWFSGGMPGTGLDTRGIYRIVGDEIVIIFDQKPYVLTWEQVEAMLRALVES
jgi:hypothetical protein